MTRRRKEKILIGKVSARSGAKIVESERENQPRKARDEEGKTSARPGQPSRLTAYDTRKSRGHGFHSDNI